MRVMSALILLFAIIMGMATFVENDFGTQSSKAVIYNAWWFELIMLLLTINFTGNIFQYKLYRKEKWPVLIFHVAFIITLFGAFITRYFGYEGIMTIREGEVSEVVISEKTYFNVIVDKGSEEKMLEKEVMFGPLHNSNFKIKQKIGDTRFNIEYLNYYLHAKSGFIANLKGEEHLHLIISSEDGRKDIYIPSQESIEFGKQVFSYNKLIPDAMNFVKTDTGISFRPAQDGVFMDMKAKDTAAVLKDSLVPAKLMTLYRFNKLHFVMPENAVKGEQKLVSASKEEQGDYPLDALLVKITSGSESKNVYLYGGKNIVGKSHNIELNGLKFTLNYGSKNINIPFGVKLRDFQMERYPGTNSASSYASEVTVIDKDKVFDFRIFMNHVLDYKGYRFFQSSYDSDELGTVLQVNHDFWGTLITYIGYFFMGIGMFFTLFWKGSRFSALSDKLKKLSQENAVLLVLFSIFSLNVYSQEMSQDTVDPHKHVLMPKVGEDKLLNIVDRNHADKFGKLLIQDHQGRIKPVNTYALEALRKVYKKDFYKGLSAEQVMLSGQLDPYYWEGQYIIHVKPQALGERTSSALAVFEGYTSISKFFENDHETYYLQNLVADANQKKNMDRTSTDKEIINLDERFNVLVSIFNGDFVKLYPKIGDTDNKWYAGMDQELMMSHDTIIPKLHRAYLGSLVEAVQTGDYTKADENLERISAYQLKNGASIIPSSAKIDLEVKYNHWNIFKKLMMYYMLIGFLLLIATFFKLFTKESKITKIIITLLSIATLVGMLFHLFGLSARAYISGHAPWSNGYEAIVFVAFISVLAGFIFSYQKEQVSFSIYSDIFFIFIGYCAWKHDES